MRSSSLRRLPIDCDWAVGDGYKPRHAYGEAGRGGLSDGEATKLGRERRAIFSGAIVVGQMVGQTSGPRGCHEGSRCYGG